MKPAAPPSGFTPLSEAQAIGIRDQLLRQNSDAARGALRLLFTAFPHLHVASDQVSAPKAPSLERAVAASRTAAITTVRDLPSGEAIREVVGPSRRLPQAEPFIRPIAVDGVPVAIAKSAPKLDGEAILASRADRKRRGITK